MNIHCIGVGESALCHLAVALQAKGDAISGSDVVMEEASRSRLATAGLLPEALQWSPDKIHSELDAVLLSTAVKPDNPEFQRAQALGVPHYTYADFLYEHAKYKTRVVIAGTHGKAVIMAMLLHVLRYHSLPADYKADSLPQGENRRIHLTEENDFMIIEAEGYPDFLHYKAAEFKGYRPNIGLLSDIDQEAGGEFAMPEGRVKPFETFVAEIVKGGSIIYNREDPKVKEIVERSENTIRKLPYYTPAHRVVDGIFWLDTPEGEIPLEIFGIPNLTHLAGARWICQQMGVDETSFYEAMTSFKDTTKSL